MKQAGNLKISMARSFGLWNVHNSKSATSVLILKWNVHLTDTFFSKADMNQTNMQKEDPVALPAAMIAC